MKTMLALLLSLVSATASADWVKINNPADASFEKFIDAKAIRQTGPMNTMRRVRELNNLAQSAANKALSVKHHVEYDCKDRRVRMLDESTFSAHWALGENLAQSGPDSPPGPWSDIGKGSLSETIFYRVCPHDGS